MQTEDKRNQIKSWFTILDPQEPQDQAPSDLEEGGSNFFDSLLAWGIIFGIGLIGVLIAYIIDRWNLFWPGIFLIFLIVIIIGIYYVKAKMEKRKAKDALPSTDQMIQWLEEDLENSKMSSLEKAGLDKGELEADTVLVRMPIGADGTPISETNLSRYWHLTILYIGRLSIVVYKCDYNWLSDELSDGSPAEYFYRDVVGVEAEPGRFAEINISLRGRKSVRIALNGQDSEESSNELVKAAGSIRRLLKDEGLKSHLHLTKKDEG